MTLQSRSKSCCWRGERASTCWTESSEYFRTVQSAGVWRAHFGQHHLNKYWSCVLKVCLAVIWLWGFHSLGYDTASVSKQNPTFGASTLPQYLRIWLSVDAVSCLGRMEFLAAPLWKPHSLIWSFCWHKNAKFCSIFYASNFQNIVHLVYSVRLSFHW
jgi:hypothetical protein